MIHAKIRVTTLTFPDGSTAHSDRPHCGALVAAPADPDSLLQMCEAEAETHIRTGLSSNDIAETRSRILAGTHHALRWRVVRWFATEHEARATLERRRSSRSSAPLHFIATAQAGVDI